MEIWEQSDERRIAAAQTRWADELVTRRPFEHALCVRDAGWRCVTDAECATCDPCEAAHGD
jgi:hypothetical protein